MNDVNFTSSYHFPLSQPHINKTKRVSLEKTLKNCQDFGIITSYRVPQHAHRNGRISVPEKYDEIVENILKKFHFTSFKKFPMHAATLDKFDGACSGMIRRGNFLQFGPIKCKHNKNTFRYNKPNIK